MENSLFIISLLIAICFVGFKMIEIRFESESRPKSIKFLVRDTLFVYASSVLGLYVWGQFNNSNQNSIQNPLVFAGEPGF
jgi:membrane protein CcdC involved in cytochrome C biogenesis